MGRSDDSAELRVAEPDKKKMPDYANNPEALIGTVIDDRYKISGFIGQGGMGAVYAGEHVTIRRQVAVKILHPAMAQMPEIVRRFEREAFAIGRIDHPNCVNVSDFGSLEDGSLYLVMEFLNGQSLGDVIDDGGPMATPRALHVLRHILKGLGHAHKAGIVHRDMKPENVVLIENDDDKDFAKILDFGIAKLVGDAQLEDDTNLTQAGIAFGTPTYMSPEQTMGDPVDPRADLYSATILLYEMIAGRPPFRSDDKLELMGMHATKKPPPVTDFHPDALVSPAIAALIERGLAKRPGDRFQSVKEYIGAIDDIFAEMSGMVPSRAPTQSGFEVSGAYPHLTTGPQELLDASGPVPLNQAVAELSGPVSRTSAETPAPRAQTVAALWTKNRMLIAAIGVVVLVLAAIVLFAGGDNNKSAEDGETPAVEEETPMTDSRSELARAGEGLLKQGKPKAAYELLRKAGDAIEKDADAQLVLGHALAVQGKGKKAIAAYRKVLALDDSHKFDAEMHANLTVLFNDKRNFGDAATLLIKDLGDAEFRKKLLERTNHPKSGEWRHLALKAAEELGMGDEVNHRKLYELDLVQGSRCQDRKAAVAKLRALGDPKSIPALKAASVRRGTRGRTRGRKINSCLQPDALRAIQYLKTLAKNQEPE